LGQTPLLIYKGVLKKFLFSFFSPFAILIAKKNKKNKKNYRF